MVSKEIKYIYIEEAMSILDNEELMQATLEAVRKIKAKFAKRIISDDMPGGVPALQYSLEELNNILDRAETDRIAGHFTPSEDVFRELENEYPFLCK